MKETTVELRSSLSGLRRRMWATPAELDAVRQDLSALARANHDLSERLSTSIREVHDLTERVERQRQDLQATVDQLDAVTEQSRRSIEALLAQLAPSEG